MSPSPRAALLDRYEALIRAWAPRLDLVAPRDLPRLRERHIADSLRLVEAVDAAPDGPAVDVGSGAGFPGIPLAICARPRPWRLLEPRARRAAFLEEVVRALDLDVEVRATTAEQVARETGWRAAHAVVTARAVAPPRASFDALLPLVVVGGSALVFVGRRARLPAEAEEILPGVARITRMGFGEAEVGR